MARRKDSDIEVSSGNVFADLGIANADEEQTKVRLALAINQSLDGLTQMDAAKRLGTKQPNVSALRNYRLDGFSAERLMHFLNALGQDVEIVIRKKPRWRAAAIFVTGAALATAGLAARGRKRRPRGHGEQLQVKKYA
jgi:predicted XRE-type DNA-binding protein